MTKKKKNSPPNQKCHLALFTIVVEMISLNKIEENFFDISSKMDHSGRDYEKFTSLFKIKKHLI